MVFLRPRVDLVRLIVPMTQVHRRKALIVEADIVVRRLVRVSLLDAGFAVHDVGDGDEGLRCAHRERVDVLIVGAAWSQQGVLALCRAIRARGANSITPIMLLGDSRTESLAIQALDTGAYDFVIAPFHPRELQARVSALLRRHRAAHGRDDVFVLAADLRFDARQRVVTGRDRTIVLTPREADVLRVLVACRNEIVSREQLRRDVWGDAAQAPDRAVDLLVSRLRRKIEADPRTPRLIRTAWGIGYTLIAE